LSKDGKSKVGAGLMLNEFILAKPKNLDPGPIFVRIVMIN